MQGHDFCLIGAKIERNNRTQYAVIQMFRPFRYESWATWVNPNGSFCVMFSDEKPTPKEIERELDFPVDGRFGDNANDFFSSEHWAEFVNGDSPESCT